MATFTNQATLSYSGGTVNSNITTGEILEVLSATKTAVVNEYSDNTLVTYIVNIVNTSSAAFTNLTVTDNLGLYSAGGVNLRPLDYVENSVKYFVNGNLQASPTVTAGDTLVISPVSVPAGGNATIAYTVRTNGFASPETEGTVTNTAVVSGTGITSVTATETINAAVEPKLTITKSVSPTTVSENSQITYTFLIQNTGNTDADVDDNVIITDTFNPALSDISVTYNSTAWTEGVNYAYNEATGLFTTLAGQITVPAATFAQNATTGEWATTPSSVTLTVTGTI